MSTSELAVRHRQFFRQTALDRNRVELAVSLAAALASRRKQDALAIGRPANDAVGHRVIRQPLRLAAGHRHDIDIDVAVVDAL